MTEQERQAQIKVLLRHIQDHTWETEKLHVERRAFIQEVERLQKENGPSRELGPLG